MEIAQFISDFGFPVVATIGLLYTIYYIWKYITSNISQKLSEAHITLVGLIDRIRMLDNAIIRLQQKLDTVIELREAEQRDAENQD